MAWQLIALAFVAGFGIWFIVIFVVPSLVRWQQRRTDHLQARYGRRYFEAVIDLGNEPGERALAERESDERRSPLSPRPVDGVARFEARWAAIDASFEADPAAAVAQADRLVAELLAKRGIDPARASHDGEQLRSLDHYREARAFKDRAAGGSAGQDDLDRAMTHLRTAVQELL